MAAPPHALLLVPPFALLTLGPALLPLAVRPRPGMEQQDGPEADETQWYFEDTDPEDGDERDGGAEPARLEEAAARPTPAPTPVEAPLDALLDWVLSAAAHEFGRNGSRLQLPDFQKTFKAKFGVFSAKGHFSAHDGSVGDLNSLFRSSPVSLLREGDTLLLHAAAGLGNLTLRYTNYTASVGRVSVSGTLEAETTPAVVSAYMALDQPCGVRVRGLTLSHIGPLTVRASGLGPLNRLVPLLSRWLDRRIHADVVRIVDEQLQLHAKDLLRRFACDD